MRNVVLTALALTTAQAPNQTLFFEDDAWEVWSATDECLAIPVNSSGFTLAVPRRAPDNLRIDLVGVIADRHRDEPGTFIQFRYFVGDSQQPIGSDNLPMATDPEHESLAWLGEGQFTLADLRRATRLEVSDGEQAEEITVAGAGPALDALARCATTGAASASPDNPSNSDDR